MTAKQLHEQDKWKYNRQLEVTKMIDAKTTLKHAAVGSVLAEGVDLISIDEFKSMGYEGATSLIRSRLKARMERMTPLYHHSEADYWDDQKGDDSSFVCYQWDIQEIKKAKEPKVSQKEIGEMFTMLAGTLTKFAERVSECGVE